MKTILKTALLSTSLCAVVGLSGISFTTQARAADAPQKLECIKLMNIEDSPVIDDKTILLKMRSGDVHYKRLDLASTCTGIDFDGWTHQTGYDELCSSDTLISRAPGGAVCKIGHIVNISDTDAKALMSKRK